MKKCTATKTEELAIKFLSKYMEYNSFWETDSHQAGKESSDFCGTNKNVCVS